MAAIARGTATANTTAFLPDTQPSPIARIERKPVTGRFIKTAVTTPGVYERNSKDGCHAAANCRFRASRRSTPANLLACCPECSTSARISAMSPGSPALCSSSELAVSSILLTATKGLASRTSILGAIAGSQVAGCAVGSRKALASRIRSRADPQCVIRAR